ncbi:MAG TPA: GNAT family N-acetyltransferase [Streptosporangiaceae bacterium]|nr:GNAT family N-acetyltransferase [Streptosporangiaceae bacterium]
MTGTDPATAQQASVLVTTRLRGWEPQWDGLVTQSPLPSPFLRSWWLTGAGGPQPRFVLVLGGDHLLGGLALEEGRCLGLPCLRLMASGPLCPDHLDLVASRGHETAVAAAVRSWLCRPGTRLLNLEGITPTSLLATALPGHVHREALAAAPWTPLSCSADAYLAARPKNFRRNLSKATTRLAGQGAAHRTNRGEAAVQSLDTLRRLHHAQWGARSRFLPAFGRFAAACRLAAHAGELAVHELHTAETVIASLVTFEVAHRLTLYQSARLLDPRWRDATTVLLAKTLSDACERGFTEADFLRGTEPYKDNFTSQRRELLRYRAAHGRPARTVLRAETSARKAKADIQRLAPRR